MNQILIELKDIIFCEITSYKELLALSKQKKEILVKNNVKDLNDIVESEQNELKKIKKYEAERDECVIRIAETFGMPHQDLDFSTIADLAKGELQKELGQLRTQLKDIISQLSFVNSINNSLLDTHLKYVSFCMEALTSHLKGLSTYSSSGKAYDSKIAGYGLMDTSV